MGEVPAGDAALRMGRPRQSLHVEELARQEVDGVEQHQRHLAATLRQQSLDAKAYRATHALIPGAVLYHEDGQTLQLTPLLYQILEAADGRRGCDEIAGVVREAVRREVSADMVATLADQHLRPLGHLQGVFAVQVPRAEAQIVEIRQRHEVADQRGAIVGPLPEPTSPSADAGRSEPAEPSALELEAGAAIAAAIRDDDLRRIVSKTAALSLARAVSDRSLW